MKLCIVVVSERDTFVEQEIWLGEEKDAREVAKQAIEKYAPTFVRARLRSVPHGPHHPNVQFWWRQKAREHARRNVACPVVPEWAQKTYSDAFRRVRK